MKNSDLFGVLYILLFFIIPMGYVFNNEQYDLALFMFACGLVCTYVYKQRDNTEFMKKLAKFM